MPRVDPEAQREYQREWESRPETKERRRNRREEAKGLDQKRQRLRGRIEDPEPEPEIPTYKFEANPHRPTPNRIDIADPLDPNRFLSQQEMVLRTGRPLNANPWGVEIKEILFGGAPGGGKTALEIGMALEHAQEYKEDAFVGMFRQAIPEFREILTQSRRIYPDYGGVWNGRDRWWSFPDGGIIQMTYVDTLDDALGHKGSAYSLLLWDELTGWPDSDVYDFIMTRLRSTNPDIFCQSVSSANPDGPGMWWVREHFRIMEHPAQTPFEVLPDIEALRDIAADLGEPFDESKVDALGHRIFIPSLLEDNPYLTRDEQYRNTLYAIRDPVRRKAYIAGDWSVFVGQAFPAFKPEVHVCENFKLPPNWPVWAAMDWGFTAPYCVLYFTMDPNTNRIYVFNEKYGCDPRRPNRGVQMAAAEVAKNEMMDRGLILSPQVLAVDSSIYNRTGTEKTIGDAWEEAGWVCERGNRDRRARAEKIRDLLETKLLDGLPAVRICERCINLIRTIPLMVMDEKRPEEIKDGGEDHPVDTFGYGVMCTIATALQAILMRASKPGHTSGPDRRNFHYEPNRDWNRPIDDDRPDEGLVDFYASMRGRLTGRRSIG